MELLLPNLVVASWLAECESGFRDPDVMSVVNKLKAADLRPYFRPWEPAGWRSRVRGAWTNAGAWSVGSSCAFDAPDEAARRVSSAAHDYADMLARLRELLGADGRAGERLRALAAKQRASFAPGPDEHARVAGELPADRSVKELCVVLTGEQRRSVRLRKAWRVVPPEIGELTQLERLELTGHLFTGLPPEIGRLSALRALKLGSDRLASLPPEIGMLGSLEILVVSWCGFLRALPAEIGRLESLRELWLEDCHLLSTVPAEIASCRRLERVELKGLDGTTRVAARLREWLPTCDVRETA